MPRGALHRVLGLALLGVVIATGAGTSGADATGELPPVGTITRSYTRPGANRPAVLAGVLSGVHEGSPVIIARGYLAAEPDPIRGVPATSLRLERVRWHGQGAAVKFQQTWNGLDVIGGTVAVRVDESGRIRWISSGVTPIPTTFDGTPTIGESAAVAALGSAAGTTRLVVVGDPVFDVPRLAWEVTLPRDLLRVRAVRGYVDARTGEILSVRDAARHADPYAAQVYQWNPVVSPLGVTALDLPDGALELTGPDVVAMSCIDMRTCQILDVAGTMQSYHYCTPMQLATTDGQGTFLDITPPSVDTNPVDAFAEVQLYYHLGQAYQAFRGFAQDGTFSVGGVQPITAMANFRLPGSVHDARCSGPIAPATSLLAPFDDAVYLPGGGGDGDAPWLLMGQGTAADLAYDGDLVFHEMAHAVIAAVSPLSDGVHDPFGVDESPAALHEAYADYFAAVISGDPEIAEYAGAGLGSPRPSGALRSAENTRRCPDDLSGEPHRDGEAMLGALWVARQSLAFPEERAALDAAVFATVDMLGAADTAATAQVITAAEVDVMLGMDTGNMVSAQLRARGMDDCSDRAATVEIGDTWSLLHVGGAVGAAGFQPAPLQFEITLPQAATRLDVQFSASQLIPAPGATAPELKLLVKPGNDPIRWAWDADGHAAHDAPLAADVMLDPLSGPGTGTMLGDLPAGSYRVQLANAGGTEVALHDLTFSYAAAPEGVDAGVVKPPDTDPGPDGNPPQGCACRAGRGGAGGAAGAGLLLAVAALLTARSRRRRS